MKAAAAERARSGASVDMALFSRHWMNIRCSTMLPSSSWSSQMHRPWRRGATACGLVLGLLCVAAQADTLIVNALIVDGSGSEPRKGSLRIAGERIAAVGDIEPARG